MRAYQISGFAYFLGGCKLGSQLFPGGLSLGACIFDSLLNPLIVIDGEQEVVIFNEAAERTFGLKAQEAIGRKINEVLPQAGLSSVVRTGEAKMGQRIAIGGKNLIYNVTPLRNREKAQGVVALFFEESAQEDVAAEVGHLRELTREYDAMFDSSYDGIFITDAEGRVIKANRAFERLSGYRLDRFMGTKLTRLIEQGYIDHSATLEALETGRIATKTHRTRAGQVLVETSTPILGSDGLAIRAITNLRDITELNSLKEQLDRSEALSQRYYHELRHVRKDDLIKRGIIFKSDEMRKVIDLASRIAPFDTTVIIEGQSGVGKELVARAIHGLSRRSKGPFIDVNCGAIPESLIESELFGYEKGSFTGARVEGKMGMFELADMGTVFLDEIGDLPLSCQPKLLKVLQDGTISKIGSKAAIKVDVRVIVATNKDLESMVRKGEFREDLYYRLKVVPIVIPPLRQRREDIPPLIYHFFGLYNRNYNLDKTLSPEVVEILCRYDWPGNVRQLENLIERLMVSTRKRKITAELLPEEIISVSGDYALPTSAAFPQNFSMGEAVRSFEKALLKKALRQKKTTYGAAEILKVNQSTVYRKAKKYDLIP